jgi:hypothetical protein
MGKNIQKTYPNFAWEVTTDPSNFRTALGVYRIAAHPDSDSFRQITDLIWPEPSVFLKSPKLKESVWGDVQEKVIPALTRAVLDVSKLVISTEELQKLLSVISDAKKSFIFDHPDGYTVGVNTTQPVDISLSTADIASMLAASWIFGAKGIRIS